MNKYKYFEPDSLGNNITVIVNEKYIIDVYWNFYKSKMESKYGKHHELITKKNCIEDFIIVNWANKE